MLLPFRHSGVAAGLFWPRSLFQQLPGFLLISVLYIHNYRVSSSCKKIFCRYNSNMAKKGGRPTRDPGGTASKLVPIRLTEAEHESYRQAAERAGVSTSEWMRERLNKAAKRESKRD